VTRPLARTLGPLLAGCLSTGSLAASQPRTWTAASARARTETRSQAETHAQVQSPTRATAPAATTPEAAAILREARKALGGDAHLDAITSFAATGRTRQVRGDNLVPIEFEINCELPDKYVRRDEIPAQESGPTSAGFNGDGLVAEPAPPMPPPRPARPGGPPPPGPEQQAAARAASFKARVRTLKQDFVKLTLGMFAQSFVTYPLTFAVLGKAEAPQGTADVLLVRGPDDFTLRFFVDQTTHLPIMVSWQVPATNAVMAIKGQPAPANVPEGAVVFDVPPPPPPDAAAADKAAYAKTVADLRKKALASAPPIEHRIYYAEYRDAGGGVKFPFRLRQAVGLDTTAETNFDGFKLNAKIDPKKFEVVK
jgi:hypothetical protein